MAASTTYSASFLTGIVRWRGTPLMAPGVRRQPSQTVECRSGVIAVARVFVCMCVCECVCLALVSFLSLDSYSNVQLNCDIRP